MSVDHSPTRTSTYVAVLAAILSVGAVAMGTGSAAGTLIGALGAVWLTLGTVRGSRPAVSVGAFVAFAGVIVGGLGEASPTALLVGTAAAVIAWDVGEQAISVGQDLGRAAPTAKAEVAHAASSILVGTLAVGTAYAVFTIAAGGRPLASLVVLLIAALALAAALRD